MKDIKVIFNGTKAPSGKSTGIVYMMGDAKVKQLEGLGFDMEVSRPEKPKVKKKAKKEKE